MGTTGIALREQTLREWMVEGIKKKSQDAAMFCDPSKKRMLNKHEVYAARELAALKVKEAYAEELAETVLPIKTTAKGLIVGTKGGKTPLRRK
jgi:hypothetical protein